MQHGMSPFVSFVGQWVTFNDLIILSTLSTWRDVQINSYLSDLHEFVLQKTNSGLATSDHDVTHVRREK